MPDHPFVRYREVVDDWPAFVEACARPLPTCVWANPLRTSAGALAAGLAAEGVRSKPVPWFDGALRLEGGARPGTLLPFRVGLMHVQEEVSLLPPVLLAPRAGERVLDLCAAPGNKTAMIGCAMEGRGTVVANDRSEGRLHILRRTLARLGVTNVLTTRYDAARFPGEDAWFDAVLADVPCSCEGTVRKHPGTLPPASGENSRRLGGVQKAILRRAVHLCRPGGRLVYATCTFAPEENEAVLDAVLHEADGGVRLLPARLDGLTAAAGLEEWDGRRFDPSVRHALRIWPHQNDSGGFFAALLEKAAA